MIVPESRYFNARVDVLPNDNTVALERKFPPLQETYVVYTWKESDRLDRIAARFFGNRPDFWWKIMDANPLIQNPHDIRPGTQIRIPRRV